MERHHSQFPFGGGEGETARTYFLNLYCTGMGLSGTVADQLANAAVGSSVEVGLGMPPTVERCS